MYDKSWRYCIRQRILHMDPSGFEALALEVFNYQAQHNELYRAFVKALGIVPSKIQKIEEIPFLPIEFFKSHKVLCRGLEPALVFESSRTTGQQASRHYVVDPAWYARVSQRIFEQFYGSLQNYHILALLPSYLERQNSSLVWMVQHFIEQSESPYSGFYLYNYEQLLAAIDRLRHLNDGRTPLLLGVTFALLEFAQLYEIDLSGFVVMETGGMKGRGEELLRETVHELLCQRFGLHLIHSEYGMTELLSQAYSPGEGIFQAPAWMRVLLREVNDPLCIDNTQRSGVVNIIDLANIDTCAFIATQDMGSLLPDGRFRITGRMDTADQRGCNLLLWT